MGVALSCESNVVSRTEALNFTATNAGLAVYPSCKHCELKSHACFENVHLDTIILERQPG